MNFHKNLRTSLPKLKTFDSVNGLQILSLLVSFSWFSKVEGWKINFKNMLRSRNFVNKAGQVKNKFVFNTLFFLSSPKILVIVGDCFNYSVTFLFGSQLSCGRLQTNRIKKFGLPMSFRSRDIFFFTRVIFSKNHSLYFETVVIPVKYQFQQN